MPDLNASELADLVDPEAIAHIIFNENRSLTGPQLEAANVAMGHVVLNLIAHGEPVGNGTVTARIGLPDDISDQERDVVLEQAREAARRVTDERSRGIDPTGGALEYNHRAVDPAAQPDDAYESRWGDRQTTGTPAKLSFGPLSNSHPTSELPKGHPVYLTVYGD
ncbi:MAG TPA: hypothetical protein VN754_11390 [Candidatus Binataceae bacterium]|nr:hypothetical protein [Candidatus Binataceae bacterium]